jgi:hypothetical protein
MTKNLSVSIDFPGPTKDSHQPGLEEMLGEIELVAEARWEEAERPVWIRMAFER